MNFRNLSEEIKEAIKKLPADETFQKIFATDKVLDDLDRQKFDQQEELETLYAFIDRPLQIGKTFVNQITPLDWEFLWCIKHPIVSGEFEKMTVEDLDLFLYVLQSGISDFQEMKARSKDFSLTLDCSPDELMNGLEILTRSAFKALELFPALSNAKVEIQEAPVYDCEWLSRLVASVNAVTGMTPKEILGSSLCACSYYFTQYSRLNGAKLFRRTTQEILDAKDLRTCELIADYLVFLGVIDESKKKETVSIMRQKYNK